VKDRNITDVEQAFLEASVQHLAMTSGPVNLDSIEVPAEELVFNGIDADRGAYLFPKLKLDLLARAIRATREPPAHLADLESRSRAETEHRLGVVYGVRPERLEEVGWALVGADDVDRRIIEALTPLRELRREQAGELYRELWGPAEGVRAGDNSQDYLIRHNVDPNDVADPRQLPYYVLLLGSPSRVPFSLQYQLGVQRAVGRLHFDTPEEYARYAENVVAAETASPPSPASAPPRVHVFATRNPGDLPTAMSSSRLALPLAHDLAGAADVGSDVGETATKRRLSELVNGDRHLDILFTATHGLGKAGPAQREVQGALLCQDWQGPLQAAGPLGEADYFSGADLNADRPISASAVFSFACYSAGTPHTTDFTGAPDPAASAGEPFVARLAQRLLTHPRGGCLAFVGHVDRAWNCSFLWKGVQPRILPFSSSIRAFLAGIPLGMAMEYISARYATTATELASLLHQSRAWALEVDDRELARLWLATNDARNFLIIGDPAIRLPAAAAGRP
jgi:hypothetical protein